MKTARTLALFAVLALFWSCAASALESFRIRQLYSNKDGSLQYVELEEVRNEAGHDGFRGAVLASTNLQGVRKTLAFPSDLPSADTASRHVVIASESLAATWASDFPSPAKADYTMPDRFLPTAGGTIDLGEIDRWTFGTLPVDGTNSLSRDGVIAANQAQTYARRQVASVTSTSTMTFYYNERLDRYFMTASAADIDFVTDAANGWTQTYEDAAVFTTERPREFASGPPAVPVCRFYVPPPFGDDHFYSASADECDAIERHYPMYVLEDRAAFYAWLPDAATGACPHKLGIELPVLYRTWNPKSNAHVFTVSEAMRDLLVGRGFIAEGYGPSAVAMCLW